MTRRAMIVLVSGWLRYTSRLVAQGTSSRNDTSPPGVYNVSLIRVIANPNDYNDQRLRIVGYLGPNGIDRSLGIFLSEIDGRNFILSNSIDLHVDESVSRGLVRQYVIVSGTYHASTSRSGQNGHIDQIVDLKLWKTGDSLK
jgi:hypothetical protein